MIVPTILKRMGLAPALAGALFLTPFHAAAQEGQDISIELNDARDQNNGCQIVFVATNQSASTVEKMSYVMAIFDAQKHAQLIVMDFHRLPAGRKRVQAFDLPSRSCKDISEISVNDIDQCSIGGQASTFCLDNLKTSTRTSITFG